MPHRQNLWKQGDTRRKDRDKSKAENYTKKTNIMVNKDFNHFVEVFIIFIIFSLFRSSLPLRGQVNTNKCFMPLLAECLCLKVRHFFPPNNLASAQGQEFTCKCFNNYESIPHDTAGFQSYIFHTKCSKFMEVGS